MSSNPVDTYAGQVERGEIPAGKYHRAACVRHLQDRSRERTGGFPFRFDYAQAERFFRFASRLKHYKGKQWAGTFIELSPCQVFRLGSIFGWRRQDTGARRFTTAYNELPRKQGKSLEAAIVSLYVTFFEGEPGANGYTIATKRDQAKIVFNDARKLVQSSGLKTRIKVLAQSLYSETTDSKLEPLGADFDSTDGLNPNLICTDELHAHKTRRLLDVMESATGARDNPLHFQITTAGSDPISPCGDQHDYACKILDGVLEDDSTHAFFAFIAHADVEDDWLSEETWRKANPHYGISVNPDDIRKLALKASQMPAAAAEFKQKRLNLWVNADQPWLSLDGWRAGQTAWDPKELEGEPCFAAIDLSSVLDLTAALLLFPPTPQRTHWRYLPWILTPEDTLNDRGHRDRAPYRSWAAAGFLQTNPGNRIDQDAVRTYLNDVKKRYRIQQVGVDPWNAGNLVQHLTADGFQVVEVPQNFGRMSKPSKDFEADVLDGKVDTGKHPVMAWMASNVVVQRDGKDNIQPIKKRSRGRIDGIVAAIIARGLATVHQPVRKHQIAVFAI